jgi:hypothetical protein
MRIATVHAAALLLAACRPVEPATQGAAPTKAPEFYLSDYFVFLSSDPAAPLIVPVDINWEPRPNGQLFTELKAWRGTATPWGVAYQKSTQPLAGPYPKSFAEVPATGGFAFSAGRIEVRAAGLDLAIEVPPDGDAAAFREELAGAKEILSAARATAYDGGRAVSGWLIHERFEEAHLIKTADAPPELSHFHWIPLVAADGLYLFRDDEKLGQRALRWAESGGRLEVASLASFAFTESGHAEDAGSGRARVPVAWTISAPEWGFRAELSSSAGHTGYGPKRASGRALYRQALVRGKDGAGQPLYGMVELILED